jgi:hypothetical protein
MERRHCHISLLPAGAGRRWRQPDEGLCTPSTIVRHRICTSLSVLLRPVPSICDGFMFRDGLDPRHKAEDDGGEGENPSPTPPHEGEGLTLPLPPTPIDFSSATLNCGARRQPRVKPLPLWEGWGGPSSKNHPPENIFIPHHPTPLILISSCHRLHREASRRDGAGAGERGTTCILFSGASRNDDPRRLGTLGVKAFPQGGVSKGTLQ